MAKKLFLASDIDVAQNAILLDGNIPIERLLLITNVTAGAGKIIYNFADSTLGFLSILLVIFDWGFLDISICLGILFVVWASLLEFYLTVFVLYWITLHEW